MDILDKLLNPAVIWVVIPVLAIFFWGLSSVIRALHGEPEAKDEPDAWRSEVQKLRARVEELERSQHSQRLERNEAHAVVPK